MTTQRSPGVDAFRLLGALLVVGLHVGNFEEWPSWALQFSRASGRWVVPYFFLLIGFFSAKQGNWEEQALQIARRLLLTLFVSTIIYLVVSIFSFGLRQTFLTLVSPQFFVRGIWVHLWFLHAAIAGVLLLAVQKNRCQVHFWTLGFLLCCCSYVDMLFAAKRVEWSTLIANRFIAGVCMVLVGAVMASWKPLTLRSAVVLTLVGLLLLWVQSVVEQHLGGRSEDLQLQIGALIMAVGMVWIGFGLHPTKLLERLGAEGRKYALGIYLLHPLFIEIFEVCGHLGSISILLRSDILWISSACASLAAAICLRVYFPKFNSALDGSLVSSFKAKRPGAVV